MKVKATFCKHITRSILFIALVFSTSAFSTENYFSDMLASFPPGCATLNQFSDNSFPAPREIIAQGTIELGDLVTLPDEGTVEVQIIRQGCAENDRSVLIIGFRNLETGESLIPLPQLTADVDGDEYTLRIAKEPNTWLSNDSFDLLPPVDDFLYFFISAYHILDGLDDPDLEGWFHPMLYNSAFKLVMTDGADPDNSYFVDIPAYENELKTSTLPINGRLAGNWVSAGAEFQGLLISVNETTDGQSFFFLSWYTFGSDNKSIWMTASQFFDVGDTSVTMPIYTVENQIFLGDNGNATVTEAGEITIQLVSCNNLVVTYRLSSLGLGSGAVTFTRLFDAAISGYSCRDAFARIESQMNNE